MRPLNFENFLNYLSILFLINFFLPNHVCSYDMATYDFLENQTEIIDQEMFYTPFPAGKSNSFLPICFVAHVLEKLSYFMSGYLVLSAGLHLKENLNKINNNYYWPTSWFAKLGYYGQFSYVIGMTLAKLILLRWGVKLIINATCPKELKKQRSKDSRDTD